MNVIETPQTRCRASIARCDITPPVGIYHHMWGAATHDRATGIHRPLFATLLWLEPASGDREKALLLAALDHCILDDEDVRLIQRAVSEAAPVRPEQVLVTLSHTHAAGLMSRSRVECPGGELIGPYLDKVAEKLALLAHQARSQCEAATILYGAGRCDLAANRDCFDAEHKQYVCGLNPDGPADDTVLVAKIVAEGGRLLGAIVNYACHPTTLAWQNTLISPDYVGALRETVEQHIRAPCLFLQGASGDLGPREGFVGETAVADHNGRQVAFAALAALESFAPPGTRLVYTGPVVSGAVIGTWKHQPLDEVGRQRIAAWNVSRWDVPLSYRSDLPTIERASAQLARWLAEEEQAKATRDDQLARNCHARVEQAQRQLWRLKSLPSGSFPFRITLTRLGDAVWVFVPGEHYQILQTTLRNRFPCETIVVTTLAGGWQPGYIPPAETYGRGIYQEQIAVVAAGSAEEIIESIIAHIRDGK